MYYQSLQDYGRRFLPLATGKADQRRDGSDIDRVQRTAIEQAQRKGWHTGDGSPQRAIASTECRRGHKMVDLLCCGSSRGSDTTAQADHSVQPILGVFGERFV